MSTNFVHVAMDINKCKIQQDTYHDKYSTLVVNLFKMLTYLLAYFTYVAIYVHTYGYVLAYMYAIFSYHVRRFWW